jgi:hypothetical protein
LLRSCPGAAYPQTASKVSRALYVTVSWQADVIIEPCSFRKTRPVYIDPAPRFRSTKIAKGEPCASVRRRVFSISSRNKACGQDSILSPRFVSPPRAGGERPRLVAYRWGRFRRRGSDLDQTSITAAPLYYGAP